MTHGSGEETFQFTFAPPEISIRAISEFLSFDSADLLFGFEFSINSRLCELRARCQQMYTVDVRAKQHRFSLNVVRGLTLVHRGREWLAQRLDLQPTVVRLRLRRPLLFLPS